MEITVTRRKTCRLCDRENLELAVPIAPTPVAEKYVTEEQLGQQEKETYPLDLYMCCDCGHVQLLDIVDPEFLFDSYTYESSNTAGFVRHFEKYADNVYNRVQPAGDALAVNIGSNDGGHFIVCFPDIEVIGAEQEFK